MKNLKDIIESQNFLVNKKLKNRQTEYEYQTKNFDELKDIIVDLLKKGITDLNCIDVSNIKDMSCLFWAINKRVTVKDIDISKWDVSNVIDMGSMFSGCYDFNSDLSKWNVSKVTNMTAMFEYCTKFNSDLSNWNISNVKSMIYMFDDCTELIKNNKIPDWFKK